MTVPNSLWPHELQPCQASLSFTTFLNLLKSMCIESVMPSNPVSPFSSCPESSPASRSFPMSRLFTSGSQNIGASASAWIRPMNIQGWFPLGLTGLISLMSKELSRFFSSTTVWKHQFFTECAQKGAGSLGYRKIICLKHLGFVDRCVAFSFCHWQSMGIYVKMLENWQK